MNKVIGGDYMNGIVDMTFTGKVYIFFTKGFSVREKIILNRETVASYSIIDKTEKTKVGSGLVRSAIGHATFGVAGAMVGAASAKKKTKFMVNIQFIDGKNSTLELDNNMFRLLIGCL